MVTCVCSKTSAGNETLRSNRSPWRAQHLIGPSQLTVRHSHRCDHGPGRSERSIRWLHTSGFATHVARRMERLTQRWAGFARLLGRPLGARVLRGGGLRGLAGGLTRARGCTCRTRTASAGRRRVRAAARRRRRSRRCRRRAAVGLAGASDPVGLRRSGLRRARRIGRIRSTGSPTIPRS